MNLVTVQRSKIQGGPRWVTVVGVQCGLARRGSSCCRCTTTKTGLVLEVETSVGRGRLLGVWDAWEGEGSAVGDVGGHACWGHLGDGAVAQTDLVVSGDGVCGEDVDRAGVVGGTAAGDHGPGAAVGGRSARRGRGDGGVVGSSVAGDMVNGVGCGSCASARPVSMTVTGSQ